MTPSGYCDIKDNDEPDLKMEYISAGNLLVARFSMAAGNLGMNLRRMVRDLGLKMGLGLDLRKSKKCHWMPWRESSLIILANKGLKP